MLRDKGGRPQQRGRRRGRATTKMTAARFLAQTCHAQGVTHVFFMESILRRVLIEMEALGIKRVLTHSEKAAAYMADGYARAGRRPGICMSQSVGAANLASGLQDAFLGLSPVIALTGRKPPLAQYRHAYQEIDHGPLFEKVTKFNARFEAPEQLPFLLRQAFREATSGVPGPIHMDVMGFVGEQLETAEGDWEVAPEPAFSHYPAVRCEPDPGDVKKVADVLGKVRRPVIVAGGGAAASSAGRELVQLAELLSIPVATSLSAKGIFPENHALSAGVTGTYSRWCANQIVYEADLVMFIGSRTGDQVTTNWTIPKPGTAVIQVDIDPSELGRSLPNCAFMMGDAKLALSRLVQQIGSSRRNPSWSRRVQHLTGRWRYEHEAPMRSPARPIHPARICGELNTLLPDNAVLVADTGFSSIWTGTMVELTKPDQRYLRAAGSLGWGLPAALGAKCALPDRPVICFCGDGGVWYHLSELETARRCGIKTVTIINNNSSLLQGQASIDRAYGDRAGAREELYRYRDTNFARMAEEMGCRGIRVESPEEIASSLKDALASDLPVVIDVVTDQSFTPAKAWTPA